MDNRNNRDRKTFLRFQLAFGQLHLPAALHDKSGWQADTGEWRRCSGGQTLRCHRLIMYAVSYISTVLTYPSTTNLYIIPRLLSVCDDPFFVLYDFIVGSAAMKCQLSNRTFYENCEAVV